MRDIGLQSAAVHILGILAILIRLIDQTPLRHLFTLNELPIFLEVRLNIRGISLVPATWLAIDGHFFGRCISGCVLRPAFLNVELKVLLTFLLLV